MKGREGVKTLSRLSRILSKLREDGIGVDRCLPQLPLQICSEDSSRVDDRGLNLASEELSNKRDRGTVLYSSFADLPSSNFLLSSARSLIPFSCSPHVATVVKLSPAHPVSSSAQIFSIPVRASSVPFATLREVWEEDKEEEEVEEPVKRHGTPGADESQGQRQREKQTSDRGRGAGSQQPFVSDKVAEHEIKNEVGVATEETTREAGWSDMGWNREEVLNWPNAISMARLLCGPLLSWMILRELWSPAFVGLVIAGISDWLDGYVARKMGINSVLGSYLDPVADKCCDIHGVYGSTPSRFILPITILWGVLICPMAAGLVGLIVARDGVLMGGAFIYRAYSLRWKWNDWQEFFKISIGGAGKVEPLFISKVNTVFQLALVGVALFQPALSIEDTYSVVPMLSWSVVVTTSISWVAYAYLYLKNPESLAALKRVAHAPRSKPTRGSS